MEFIFICGIYNDTEDDSFQSYFSPSVKNLNTKCIHITDKADKPLKSISSKYNVGIDVAKGQNMLTSETIAIFSKSNVNITDDKILEKLEMVFNSNIFRAASKFSLFR